MERVTNSTVSQDGQGDTSCDHLVEPPTPTIHTGGDDGEWTDWTSTWRRTKSPNSKNVTMRGTITRGKKLGQSIDVQLDLTERELVQIRGAARDTLPRGTLPRGTHGTIPRGTLPRGTQRNSTSVVAAVTDVANENDNVLDKVSIWKNGVHIMFFGILCFPLVFIISTFVSFYFGLLTWLNIFNYFYDEQTIWHRISICPFLILLFPLLLSLSAVVVALYAAFIQISWSFDTWRDEMNSFEKGFYGWLCSFLSLESCSPYTVIELEEKNEEQVDHESSFTERQLLDVVQSPRSDQLLQV